MSKKDKTIIIITGIVILLLVIAIAFLILSPLAKIKRESSDKISKEEGISKVIKISNPDGEEKEAVIVAPRSNPISVETGEVITWNGEIAKSDAEAGSAEAPQSSLPIELEKLPKNVIILEMMHNSITPSEFKVKAGLAVSLGITVGEKRSHTFRFEDEALSGVAVALSPGESKVISFNAPLESGEYIYFSDISDYRERGAVGKMIVE